MGFMTPALLLGIPLVGLPVILHLIMRRQPQQLVFPALQFVRSRQQANRRRFTLRHWLLLALRCLLVAGLACALARPTVSSGGGKAGAPLAVALVLDNSLRMQYVQENQTRQAAATEMAQALVERLPEDAEIAVVNLRRTAGSFVVDRGTATARLRNLLPTSSPRPLETAVREAIELVADRPEHRPEVFLFSDLSAATWTTAAIESIHTALTAAPEVQLYVVDVGVQEPRNLALGQLGIRHDILSPGESLHLEVPVHAIGSTAPPLLELYLEPSTGPAIKRGQQVVALNDNGQGLATFELSELPLGVHQGTLQLATSDPLPVDNTRYFTVEVRPPTEVLLLGAQASDALFLREALSPALLGEHQAARFVCHTHTLAQAASLDLTDYAVVALLDPPPLPETFWQALVSFAADGGGVGLFLGQRARLHEFNTGTATQLLPGPLKLQSRAATRLRPHSWAHPILAGLKDYAANIPWQVYPIWKYWEFSQLTPDAYVVLRFANNRPAIVERPLGRGRVLTMTTPVSDPLEPPQREAWNWLPTGPEPWPFVALANQLVAYLAQQDHESLTFLAGDTVALRLPSQQGVSAYVLRQPTGESLRRTLPPGEELIRIGTTDHLGHYRVASGGKARPLRLGFSVNAPSSTSDLRRVDPGQLTSAGLANQIQLARTWEEVELYVDLARSGRELFAWAITCVALVWSAEHLLANRFYSYKNKLLELPTRKRHFHPSG